MENLLPFIIHLLSGGVGGGVLLIIVGLIKVISLSNSHPYYQYMELKAARYAVLTSPLC